MYWLLMRDKWFRSLGKDNTGLSWPELKGLLTDVLLFCRCGLSQRKCQAVPQQVRVSSVTGQGCSLCSPKARAGILASGWVCVGLGETPSLELVIKRVCLKRWCWDKDSLVLTLRDVDIFSYTSLRQLMYLMLSLNSTIVLDFTIKHALGYPKKISNIVNLSNRGEISKLKTLDLDLVKDGTVL